MELNFPGLTKLKTKQIVYQDVMLAVDAGTLEETRELSSRRKAIEERIGQSSHVTGAIAREMSGGLTSPYEQGIQKLELYLPMLENLIYNVVNHKDTKMSRWVSDLKIRWTSVLNSSSIFNRTRFYQVNDLHFEFAMILFLYGAMLRERALEVLSSGEDPVKSAVLLLRKASGVYDFLAIASLTHLDRCQERPAEASHRVSSLMSLICLAEAQAASARQAEESGKSQGLLSKLHFGVTEFLQEGIDMLQVITRECKDISPRLMEFVESCKAIHELRGYKYLATSLEDDGETGAKIGLLQKALANAKKKIPKDESWRSVLKQNIDEVSRLLKKFERENDLVWHEKVPGQNELPSPKSVKIVTAIPYQRLETNRTLAFKLQ